jgi:beta-fructofuranosidase
MKRRTFLRASVLAGAGITCVACQKGQEALYPTPPTPLPSAAAGEKPTQTATPPAVPATRKLLHFKPEKTVAGDAHPFYHQGTCYLYYLDEKFNSRLVTSTNHLHWIAREIAHTPPGGDHPYSLPYFVLGVWYDEKDGLFRTYHGGPNNIMIGNVSQDLLHWDYAPKDTVVWSQERYRMQRDPYVFWNEDEQKYWVVMTCEVSGAPTTQSGAICYASSPDLTNWEKRGDLLYPATNASIECPQMFKLGQRWYLFGSIYGNGHVGKTFAPPIWPGTDRTG